MRKSILMASFLLATLYACNQEEEALKSVSPSTDVALSATLTFGERLALDQDFKDAHTISRRIEEGDSSLSTNANELLHGYIKSYYATFNLGSLSEQEATDAIADGLANLPSEYQPKPPTANYCNTHQQQCYAFSRAQYHAEISTIDLINDIYGDVKVREATERHRVRKAHCDTLCD